MTNILNYVLGGLLALAVIFGGTLWFQNNSLEKEALIANATITTLTNQKESLQANNDSLKAAIDTQNTSLLKLGEIQSGVTALFTNFNASVASTNRQIAGVKDAISKEKAPVTCQDTINYLKNARKEYK